MSTDAIYFYSKSEEFACFPNFSRHGFHLDGHYWPTVEHYFQARKFTDEEHVEKIRTAKTPRSAKSLGRSRKVKIRQDWEQVKDEVMRKAVRKKFETHDELLEILLATGNRELIENSPRDYYWGCGARSRAKTCSGRF